MSLLACLYPTLENLRIEQIVGLQPSAKELLEGRSLIEQGDVAIFECLWLTVDQHPPCSGYELLGTVFAGNLLLPIDHPLCIDASIIVEESTRVSLVERTIDDFEDKAAERAVFLPPYCREFPEVAWYVVEVLLLLFVLDEGLDGKPTNMGRIEWLALVFVGRSLVCFCWADNKRVDLEFQPQTVVAQV